MPTLQKNVLREMKKSVLTKEQRALPRHQRKQRRLTKKIDRFLGFDLSFATQVSQKKKERDHYVISIKEKSE